MEKIDKALREMDFNYLGNGMHCVTEKDFHCFLNAADAIYLDVRTDEEQKYSVYPWAKHIPLHQLPERISDLPEDKLIIPFCSSVFRASIAWVWLKAKGFKRVRTLIIGTEEIATLVKPTPIFMQGKSTGTCCSKQ